jgi:hypothetical protein
MAGGTISMDRILVAKELIKIAKNLLAIEFPTQDAYDKYMKEHPDADKSKHRVVETKKVPAKDKARFPSNYFLNTRVRQKAEEGGLMDVEDEDLTVEGLIAKMREWQESEGGVEAYIYDQTKKRLQRSGKKMPSEIKRIASGRLTAGGWGRFSEDLADVLEAQVRIHKSKNEDEIFRIIKSDKGIVQMMKEEGMRDKDLHNFLNDEYVQFIKRS